MLRIHDSLTGTKREFVPIDAGRVRLYVCGITVYDYLHLGHARMLLVFDVIVRHLRASGLQVTYVRNITDIDDKIIKRARENGESIDALTGRFIAEMNRDADALGVQRPDLEPRATQHIASIISMIERLVQRGLAYRADNDDVYFSVAAFPEYGALSGKHIDDLRAGARVEVQEKKADPLDFVLWKAAKPGEPSWESPWGPGRPGWHIECSAMSTQCLGEHFDIHGGGMDLLFPHHENEIAQSRGASGAPFVNYWLHNGFVRVDNEKMSKSLGNFSTVRDILARFRPEVVRYLIVASHYRSPLNYSDESLVEARAALTRLYTAMRDVRTGETGPAAHIVAAFNAAMDDDFNTPRAIAVLHEAAGELNRCTDRNSAEAGALATAMRQLGGVLGLLQDDPTRFLQSGAVPDGALSPQQIEARIEQRVAARMRRDFKEADRIRAELKQHGIELSDAAGKTTWTRVQGGESP